MLILTRRPGESILIDGDIRVVVLSDDGRGVRLGIEAPGNVSILREEIVDRVAEENRRAGDSDFMRAFAEALREDGTDAGKFGGEPDPGGSSAPPRDGLG